MQLSPEVIEFPTVPEADTESSMTNLEPYTLGGVAPYYPQDLTHIYTSGYAVAHIRTASGGQFLLYALCENRRTRLCIFRSINGRFVAVAPPELVDDNVIDGLSVNPQFLWVDTADGRQQLRLYVVAEGPNAWVLRFVYPDLPFYRTRQ